MNQPSVLRLRCRRSGARLGVLAGGSRAAAQDDHVHRDLAALAEQRVLDLDEQVALRPGRRRRLDHLGHLARGSKLRALVQDPLVELLVALAEGPHVDVELVDLGLGVLLDQVGELQRVMQQTREQ